MQQQIQCVHEALWPVCLCKHLLGCRRGRISERFLSKLLYTCSELKFTFTSDLIFAGIITFFQETYCHCLYLKRYCRVILILAACQRSFNRGAVENAQILTLADVSFFEMSLILFPSICLSTDTHTHTNTQLTMSLLRSHVRGGRRALNHFLFIFYWSISIWELKSCFSSVYHKEAHDTSRP